MAQATTRPRPRHGRPPPERLPGPRTWPTPWRTPGGPRTPASRRFGSPSALCVGHGWYPCRPEPGFRGCSILDFLPTYFYIRYLDHVCFPRYVFLRGVSVPDMYLPASEAARHRPQSGALVAGAVGGSAHPADRGLSSLRVAYTLYPGAPSEDYQAAALGRPTPEVRGDHRGLPGRRTWASPAAPRPPHLRPLAPRRSGEPARGYPAVALGASPAATPRQRLPGRRTCAPLHAGRGLQQR